ncbi:MAG: indolepyruvate oxidoreductase subunit beta family protein [Bradyrhizobiaceae bacterium]|nr:indolepyruvate oxidoreductase subunit beta family protein [Bradyrhizobiaceae bacterium]
MTGTRPITILIAALGGEGGGVLTNWIVAAAARAGFPAQSTSIPGVAQRTGATTYYIEILPTPWSELGGRRPVLALTPGVGDIDIAVASELVEAGRTLAAGFVSRDRTLMIASTGRVYTVAEKAALADGRYDPDRIIQAIEANAQRRLLFDMEQTAKDCGAMINAVMLGAIAGSGRLPIAADIFEAAIRADGKAVDSNLRGFHAGLAASKHTAPTGSGEPKSKRARKAMAALAALETEIAASMPIPFVTEGARRLAAYQDIDYARLYLNRLRPIQELDARVGGDGQLLRETARHLAVRMSFEDVIRVAEAKIDPERFQRIAREVGAKPGEPFKIFDFLKPGIEEFAQLLPPAWARRVLSLAERHHRLGRLHWGMEINSASVGGFLRFWMLAKLKAWRRHSYRYQQEQSAIENWLACICEAAERSSDLAMEVIELARLIKGYGDTLKRGMSNFRAIETRVIRPILSGQIHPQRGVDALASARTAALLDPEGEALENCLAEFEKQADFRAAAE